MQDYLAAEDAYARQLGPAELVAASGVHRAAGVATWLAKLYIQPDADENGRFLRQYLADSRDLSFFSRAAILAEYLHVNVESAGPQVVNAILDAVISSPGLRRLFFDSTPHPSWARHLSKHGLLDVPPPPRVDEHGQAWLNPWDAQRYLAAVAADAPDIVVQHAMTIKGFGWYIRRALEAVCAIPIELALPLVPRIVDWLKDPAISHDIGHASYELMLHFAGAGDEDASFSIYSAMIAPRAWPQKGTGKQPS